MRSDPVAPRLCTLQSAVVLGQMTPEHKVKQDLYTVKVRVARDVLDRTILDPIIREAEVFWRIAVLPMLLK